MTSKTTVLFGLGAALLLAGCGDKEADDTSATLNTAPEADAGADQSVSADETVTLDGSGSYDADGDTLTYHWGFEHVPDGSTVMDKDAPFGQNNSAGSMSTTFQPDAVGTYVISLYVKDGVDASGKDYVVVTTEEPEEIPVADAGDDQTVAVGDTVTLDGTESYDPRGWDLTYAWSLVEVPELSTLTDDGLSGTDTSAASFTADARGVYVVNLVVDNGLSSSLADSVVVTATGDDGAPTANAGEDQETEDCTSIQLDGSGSQDPDGDSLSYFWELQSMPSGSAATNDSFSDRTAESPTFWADVAGDYMLSLTVSDGQTWSDADTVNFTVAERSYNSAPSVTIPAIDTVDAGTSCCEESGYTYACDDCSDQTITIGSDVIINDSDGDPYTVEWELTSGDGVLGDAGSLETSLKLEEIEATEPDVCDDNEFTLQLTVTDCVGEVTTSTVTMSAQCCGVDAEDSASSCE